MEAAVGGPRLVGNKAAGGSRGAVALPAPPPLDAQHPSGLAGTARGELVAEL